MKAKSITTSDTIGRKHLFIIEKKKKERKKEIQDLTLRAGHFILIQARNEGRDLAVEGNEIIREACKWSPELAAACEVWKEITFNFSTIDKLDVQD
ncbi:hypothetical protein Bca101_008161 [Brassica carinata]